MPPRPADVGVEAAVAIGHDVEPGQFLVADVAGERVLILLAEAPRDHRLEEMPGAEIFRVPARARQRAGDGGRQHDVFGGAKHESLPQFHWSMIWSENRFPLFGIMLLALLSLCGSSSWSPY